MSFKKQKSPVAGGGKIKREAGIWVAFVIIAIYSLTLLTPLYYLINNSFKRVDDFLQNGAWVLPKTMYFQNYKDAVSLAAGGVSFTGMYFNSFVLTGAGVAISTLAAIATSYALARFRFHGRNLLVAIGVGSLVFPNFGSSSVVYKLYFDLNLLDTWGILIQYAAPFGMQFLILYGLFVTISGSYVEAARIDGAGEFRIMWQICIPMARGALGATAVILALNYWNDYYTPYMYLPSIKTLSLGLQELSASVSQLDRPKLFAGMVIAILPLVVIFVTMRDVIISNTVAGGLKG